MVGCEQEEVVTNRLVPPLVFTDYTMCALSPDPVTVRAGLSVGQADVHG